ncbi:MAG: hypothetical protein IKU17_05830, partial [Clostridia bacterium]|nr:hypothetical protein [Clostridia bacterium]
PEYSEVPCVTADMEETLFYHNKYMDALMEKCVATAKRCHALVFVNALDNEHGWRNTTFAIGRNGELLGKYYKKHLPPLEQETLQLDSGYTFEPSEPYILEIEGLRYAFLTCYDFYFYESFSAIARQNVDIIIGCSLQRSDTHAASEVMSRFLAYNTNAYVVRASVSFGEDSPVCGAALVATPRGELLTCMKSRIGVEVVEFDPADKYYKPAGFGNPPAAHWQYIEYGRKPWQYRFAGPAIVPPDRWMSYPRLCSHRGMNAVAPENSLPAFGAAVALGAQEIEFDLWPTKDGEIVSCHDDTLDRVSSGTGKIYEHTLAELQQLDFGGKFGEKYKGLRVVQFEDILKKFAGHTIMNIHVKTLSDHYDEAAMKKIVGLIRKYDCAQHVYFMISHDGVIRQFKEYAPDICMCVGHLNERPWEIVERAIELGAEKVQLFKPYFNQETVDKAHAHGIICNVFYADDVEEARRYLGMGIDTILTNVYNTMAQALEGEF